MGHHKFPLPLELIFFTLGLKPLLEVADGKLLNFLALFHQVLDILRRCRLLKPVMLLRPEVERRFQVEQEISFRDHRVVLSS